MFVGDTLNVGLEATFGNLQDWKGMREKSCEVDGTKAYITNDKIASPILKRRCNIVLYIHLHVPSNVRKFQPDSIV
jgi:hypothetical protein